MQDFNHGRGQGSRLEVREAHAKIVQMFGHRHEAGRRDVGRDVQAFHWENELRAHLQNSVRPEGTNTHDAYIIIIIIFILIQHHTCP